MRVRFSEFAVTELDAIADYITLDNPRRALSFSRELREAARAIADMPRGHPLFDKDRSLEIRQKPYGAYLILYTIEADTVYILHIFHAAREVEALLFTDEGKL